jgi:plasmid stabilization system protein ParE
MKLIWLTDAIADLDGIYDYYVTLNPKAAVTLYNKILDKAEILRTNPRIAPREPLLDDAGLEIRSLLVGDGKYKLTYIIENDTVVIIVVFSCRQNPAILRLKTFQRL